MNRTIKKSLTVGLFLTIFLTSVQWSFGQTATPTPTVTHTPTNTATATPTAYAIYKVGGIQANTTNGVQLLTNSGDLVGNIGGGNSPSVRIGNGEQRGTSNAVLGVYGTSPSSHAYGWGLNVVGTKDSNYQQELAKTNLLQIVPAGSTYNYSVASYVNLIQHYGLGTSSSLSGARVQVGVGAGGTVTNMYGQMVQLPYEWDGCTNAPHGSIGALYGVMFQANGPAATNITLGNAYMLYIDSPKNILNGGTVTITGSDYAIYQKESTSLNYFAGRIDLGSTNQRISADTTNHQICFGNGTDAKYATIDCDDGTIATKGKVNLSAGSNLTVSSNAITVTKSRHGVTAASAAALNTINGGVSGDLLYLSGTSAAVAVTVTDGAGNIQCGSNVVLDSANDWIQLLYDGSNWQKMASSVDN